MQIKYFLQSSLRAIVLLISLQAIAGQAAQLTTYVLVQKSVSGGAVTYTQFGPTAGGTSVSGNGTITFPVGVVSEGNYTAELLWEDTSIGDNVLSSIFSDGKTRTVSFGVESPTPEITPVTTDTIDSTRTLSGVNLKYLILDDNYGGNSWPTEATRFGTSTQGAIYMTTTGFTSQAFPVSITTKGYNGITAAANYPATSASGVNLLQTPDARLIPTSTSGYTKYTYNAYIPISNSVPYTTSNFGVTSSSAAPTGGNNTAGVVITAYQTPQAAGASGGISSGTVSFDPALRSIGALITSLYPTNYTALQITTLHNGTYYIYNKSNWASTAVASNGPNVTFSTTPPPVSPTGPPSSPGSIQFTLNFIDLFKAMGGQMPSDTYSFNIITYTPCSYSGSSSPPSPGTTTYTYDSSGTGHPNAATGVGGLGWDSVNVLTINYTAPTNINSHITTSPN